MRGTGFQKIVELITGARLGAAGAPDHTVDVEQASLRRWLYSRSATDTQSSANQGELVIFLQEDDESVGKHKAFRLLRIERRQRRNRDAAQLGALRLRLLRRLLGSFRCGYRLLGCGRRGL